MDRRKFLFQSGTIITATLLTQCGVADDTKSGESMRRPHPDQFPTPALKAIALGINAPNPHNTQAWKFRIVSDTELLMYVDETRILPATDPPTRQIHIGCGCFLSVMTAGISQYGYAAACTLLPEGEYSLAQTGKVPVAHIRLTPLSGSVDPLAQQIYTRRTNRLAYTDAELPASAFNAMVQLANPQHCSIKLIAGAPLAEHLDVLYNGMEVESGTYTTHEESRIWFRENDEKIAQHRDGINLPAGGTTGLRKFVAERLLKGLHADDWHKPATVNQHLTSYAKKVKSARAVVQFITPANTQADWIKAGMDYARFQLAATASDYFLHPMSQVLQEYPEMNTLRVQYEKLSGITEDQKIQMAVRMGKADEPFYSFRREVPQLLLT